MKKIGYLGMGSWGFSLASLLASKGIFEVVCWTTNPDLADQLNRTRIHPRFPGYPAHGHMRFTTDLSETLYQADMVIESVTTNGIRPVFERVRSHGISDCPIVITSKGIEQETGRILPEVVIQILGESYRDRLGLLGGPSFAQEVIQGMPTSVTGAGVSNQTIQAICDAFNTPSFRVYPNSDLLGVAYGGALKNIIAIACGIAEGLKLGNSAKAALMTRGLHEIRKLALSGGCKQETIYGLSGMGDLCLTCSSPLSRNFYYGTLLASGLSSHEALAKIGMVVEGVYTCVAALQMGKKHQISLPISETVLSIIEDRLSPMEAVKNLMQRAIKEEHL